MCLIVTSTSGVFPKQDLLKRAFKNNNDGWGMVYFDQKSKRIEVRRGFKWNAVEQAVNDVDGNPYVLHFRRATVGNVNTANCHPYRISGADGSTIFMAHNGGFSENYVERTNKNMSDSWHLARYYEELKMGLSWFDDLEWIKVTDKWVNGSKLVFMLPDGRITIINEKAGQWHELPGEVINTQNARKDFWLSNENSTFAPVPAVNTDHRNDYRYVPSPQTTGVVVAQTSKVTQNSGLGYPSESYQEYFKRMHKVDLPTTTPRKSSYSVATTNITQCTQCSVWVNSDVIEKFLDSKLCPTCVISKGLIRCDYCGEFESPNSTRELEGDNICDLCIDQLLDLTDNSSSMIATEMEIAALRKLAADRYLAEDDESDIDYGIYSHLDDEDADLPELNHAAAQTTEVVSTPPSAGPSNFDQITVRINGEWITMSRELADAYFSLKCTNKITNTDTKSITEILTMVAEELNVIKGRTASKHLIAQVNLATKELLIKDGVRREVGVGSTAPVWINRS